MVIFYLAITLLFLVFCLSAILFFTFQIVSIFTTDAPFVPVPKKTVLELSENIDLYKNSVFYDLGCGDARVLTALAQKYPEAKFAGSEIAFVPLILAKLKARDLKNIEIRRQDIFKMKLSDASHIFLYLYPKVINELLPRIKSQCKPDTNIISVDFQFTDLKPTKTIPVGDTGSLRGRTIFFYNI